MEESVIIKNKKKNKNNKMKIIITKEKEKLFVIFKIKEWATTHTHTIHSFHFSHCKFSIDGHNIPRINLNIIHFFFIVKTNGKRK